jgi:hypothetical protein
VSTSLCVVVGDLCRYRPCDGLTALSKDSYQLSEKVQKDDKTFPERPRPRACYNSCVVVELFVAVTTIALQMKHELVLCL